MNDLERDFKVRLTEAHIELMSDEELAACLLQTSVDPDAPGEGITRLSDRQLSNLLIRRGTHNGLIARLPDDTIEKLARKILSKYPPEEDPCLPEEDREIIQRARATMARQDAHRDPEPTVLREGK